MKTFTALLVILMLACPSFGSDDHCQSLQSEIENLKNDERGLQRLIQKNPECGKLWEALGDYYYDKKIWNQAYDSYKEAHQRLPEDQRIVERLAKTRSQTTTMVQDEKDLLALRRSLAGKTSAPPGIATESLSGKPLPSTGGPSDSTAAQRESIEVAVGPHAAITSSGEAAGPKPAKVGLLIQFGFNSAEIKADGKNLLDGFADILAKELVGSRFYVQGHCDNIGSREYNMMLSYSRAMAVKDYLTRQGVESNRFEVQAFGFDQPIFSNDTEEGRRKNRRVQFEAISD
jgi:outer membrane protein OmpA-like peptidoglycan-associated protein